jgi:hypothetical protein
LRLRIVPRAQSSRTLLPIHQAIPWPTTRYEKTARNFSAGLQLVCALAWLK